MYTDEDKVFYVKRMWAEGLTPTAASRLWGVPSRRTLAAWEKEALGGGLAVEAPRVPGEVCQDFGHASPALLSIPYAAARSAAALAGAAGFGAVLA